MNDFYPSGKSHNRLLKHQTIWNRKTKKRQIR